MVEIFQTNLTNGRAAQKLLEQLSHLFPEYRMNFDLEDCDNILRVESVKHSVEVIPIIEAVQGYGHYIAVLPD
ncbi:methyltransferase type 11 [Flagellimonas iocasae]|uniref:Methyltransferase type 11 n=1 Tax=Flagellimonas iocasae TaxID=2055905 RepID=A0ABW4XVJ2_9FLAO